MHLAGKAVGAIAADLQLGADEATHYTRLARLSGLLHDIGHAPFSHAGEAELFPKGIRHEDVGARIILERLSEIIDKNFKAFEITAQEVRRALRGLPADVHFVTEVLTGATDVDKMDYLLRDAYFCGSRSGEFDLSRLLGKISAAWTEGEGKGLRTVVYRYGALHALEEFLLARYWMFNSVYYHSVVRQLEIILTRAMKEVLEPFGGYYPEDLDQFLNWTDDKSFALLAEGTGPWTKRLRSRRPYFHRIYNVSPRAMHQLRLHSLRSGRPLRRSSANELSPTSHA
jgi:HD superfamily phosphohydrolase